VSCLQNAVFSLYLFAFLFSVLPSDSCKDRIPKVRIIALNLKMRSGWVAVLLETSPRPYSSCSLFWHTTLEYSFVRTHVQIGIC
jgi:hypothetical protein